MPAADLNCNVSAPHVNLSGYLFTRLDYLPVLQADMLAAFGEIGIKGTVLLADEGINAALAGSAEQAHRVRAWFASDQRFAAIWLKESYSDTLPFAKLKVKIRHEIITFQPDNKDRLFPPDAPAPEIEPERLKAWLDGDDEVTLLDTRNRYEIESGTFSGAIDLGIDTFSDFTSAIERAVASGELDPDKPVVTFCTGGIRCEKAAPYLQQQGFSDVYQIHGGIINYFEQCGGAHWQGDCFVFDDRVELDPSLQPTGAWLCSDCHRAVAANSNCSCGAASAANPA